jgi:selenocysteine-specific elongation factor
MRKDRFIIRDETAQRTLGGGIVIHPWARRHKRREPRLEERLQALHTEDIPGLIENFLEEHDGFAAPIEILSQFLNLKKEESQNWLERSKAVLSFSAEGERVYATERKWQALKEEILKTLRDFHLSHPLAPGMDMEELRGKLPYDIQPRLFRVLIENLAAEKVATREGNLLRLASHKIHLRDEERSMMDKIRKVLSENPLSPPDLKQVEKDLGIARTKLNDVIRVMEREKSVVRVATDLYFLSECVDKVKGLLYKYLSEHNEITAATFRDLLGSSRKYTIPLLEYLDREGITVRTGDTRRLKSSAPAGRQGIP